MGVMRSLERVLSQSARFVTGASMANLMGDELRIRRGRHVTKCNTRRRLEISDDTRLVRVYNYNNVSRFPGTGTVPRSIMALSEDMTERKAAEQALRDAEEFQRRLIACSNDCIKVLDLEGRLLWMNEGGMQALEICALSPFVNSSWIQFWEGEDANAALAAVEEARRGGTGRFTGYFATTTTEQPRWWDVVVSPMLNVEGKPERLLAV